MSDEFIIKHHDNSEDCCDVTFQCYKDKVTMACYSEYDKKALAMQLIEEAAKLLANEQPSASKLLTTVNEIIK